MHVMTGCSSWLYMAIVVGVLICLAGGPEAWGAPFKPYYGFRWFLCVVIIVLSIMCFAR